MTKVLKQTSNRNKMTPKKITVIYGWSEKEVVLLNGQEYHELDNQVRINVLKI